MDSTAVDSTEHMEERDGSQTPPIDAKDILEYQNETIQSLQSLLTNYEKMLDELEEKYTTETAALKKEITALHERLRVEAAEFDLERKVLLNSTSYERTLVITVLVMSIFGAVAAAFGAVVLGR